MLSNVQKQIIRFCLFLNCIFIFKPRTEHRGYGAAVGTTIKGCLIGFIAPNCSIPCRFPNFGLNCQKECNCAKHICNFKEGCRENMKTYKMVTNTIYTITYTRDILVHTWTKVKNINNTFPSHEDIMTKSINANKRSSLQTVIIVLSLLAFTLLCVYVSTFAMTPQSRELGITMYWNSTGIQNKCKTTDKSVWYLIDIFIRIESPLHVPDISVGIVKS